MNKEFEKYFSLYLSIEKVKCPYFDREISFNSKGLNHLKFNGEGKARSKKEQISRLKLLKYIKDILEKSYTLQGLLSEDREEKIRKYGKNETKIILVNYYEFIAVTDQKRIKIILKQIDNGNIFFWSVIPFWKKGNNGRKIDSLNKEEK